MSFFHSLNSSAECITNRLWLPVPNFTYKFVVSIRSVLWIASIPARLFRPTMFINNCRRSRIKWSTHAFTLSDPCEGTESFVVEAWDRLICQSSETSRSIRVVPWVSRQFYIISFLLIINEGMLCDKSDLRNRLQRYDYFFDLTK